MAMEGGWLQLLTDSLFHSSSLFSMWDVTPFSKCMTKDSYQPSVFPSFYMFFGVTFDRDIGKAFKKVTKTDG